MEISAIIAEWGAYYRNQGQNKARLLQLLRRALESEAIFTSTITDETLYEASRVSFGRLVQAYQKKFTPINPLKFEPLKIQMFHHKVDTSETPHDLEATWLGFLADNNVKPSEWPFVRWWIEQQIVPQIAEDMEVLEIGQGVRVEPTAGTPGAAGNGMDGFLTIIKKHITAGRTAPITMGAIPASDADFVTYMEDFSDMINKKYWKKPMEVNVSEELERKYQRGVLDKYGKNYVGNEQTNAIRFSNLKIVGRASMDGSNRVFCSPKDNSLVLKKKTENQNRFDVQPFEREVKILTDWWYGVGFVLPELIFASDQA
jgi:hypothetical protein